MIVNLILIALPYILVSLVISYTPSVLWFLLSNFYWKPTRYSWREIRISAASEVRHRLRHRPLSSMEQSCWEDMRAHRRYRRRNLLIGMPVELLLIPNYPLSYFPAHLLIDPICNTVEIFGWNPVLFTLANCCEGFCGLWACTTFAALRKISRLFRIHRWKVSRGSLIPRIRSICNSMR